MDFKGFKKVHEDDDKAIMEHPRGHKITISKQGLSYRLRRHLSDLPLQLKNGGEVTQAQVLSQGFLNATGINAIKKPQPQSTNPLPMNYADGGDVADNAGSIDQSQPEETEVVPQAMPDRSLASAPPEPVNPIGANNGLPEAQSPQAQPDPYESIPGFKQAENAVNLGNSIQAREAQAQEGAIRSHIAAEAKAATAFQAHQQELMSNIQSVTKDIDEGHINPDHFMQSRSVMQKIGMAVGMILAGYGTKGVGENPALRFVNDQINRDMEAQKADLGKKENLLSALHKQYGDNIVSENMYRAIRANDLNNQIQLAAVKDGSLKAKQNALMAQAQLMQTYGPLVQQAAARRMAQQVEGQGGQSGDPSQAQAYLQYLRQTDPKKAADVEKRYIPSVGIASVPVPEKAREEITTRKSLHDALQDLNSFAEKNSGSLNMQTISQGRAKSALVQDLYRRANGQGVFREAEADFVKSIIDQDPTKFFGSLRTNPKYKEAIKANADELNGKLKSFGLPATKAPAEYKTVNGVKYMKGPNGEAIKVK